MHSKRHLKDIVIAILESDIKARDSDKYLYVEVIRRTNPELVYAPFAFAMTDKDIPSFETVRRSRQYAQAHYPRLAASDTTEAMRTVQEKEYLGEFVNGRWMDKAE